MSRAGLPAKERPLRRKNGEIVVYKRGPNKGKPRMVQKTGAWFHYFRRTAIRNLERMGIPRSVAKLMVGHKTDSVYERYNVASKKDLAVAREEMERTAMQRLCNNLEFNRSTSQGQSMGKVSAKNTPADVQDARNLLESKLGPVAHKDRAAVS